MEDETENGSSASGGGGGSGGEGGAGDDVPEIELIIKVLNLLIDVHVFCLVNVPTNYILFWVTSCHVVEYCVCFFRKISGCHGDDKVMSEFYK
jgi:hypothetical protein